MRASLLVRLYPARWRRRYEDEFRALLDDAPLPVGLVLDVVTAAWGARLAPYPEPTQEGRAMTTRRRETAAAIAALLLVLPAVVMLTSAVVRLMQPVQYEPARTADAIVTWFTTLHAGGLVLVVAPMVALVVGSLAFWLRPLEDADLRRDVALFVAVTGRILRRPGLVAGVVAVVGSAAVLVFIADHAIAG